ncbi:DNA polymerase I, partial [Candidatus Uhrbacteria bacterium]|nr:DNA polymerase I [Candidatus Uhrbacteria bacterium]
MKKDTFLVLDGNALLHRAWHAIPPLTTKDGLVVNAAYGFAMIVEKMLERFKPDYMAVAWDLPGGTFRNELYKEYKAGRAEKEQELYDQIDLIQEILEAFGIPSVDAAGFEADDIIGTFSRQSSEKGLMTLIVTGDLDALQLVTDDVHVVFFVKGVSETKTYDVDAVKDRYGLSPDQVIDYKALRGDSSDNIPGLKGVGDKTATLLLQEHKTIEGIYKAIKADEVPEKFAKKFRGFEADVELAKELVTIVLDVKTGFKFESAKLKDPDWDALIKIYRNLEFQNLLRKHKVHAETKPIPKKASKKAAGVVKIVNNGKELGSALTELDPKMLGVILNEQAPDLFGATLSAVCLSDGGLSVVVPNPNKKSLELVSDTIGRAKIVVGHDIKALMHASGWEMENGFDVMIASYLLHSGTRAHDLVSIAHKHIEVSLPELPDSFAKEADYKKLAAHTSVLAPLAIKMRKELKESGTEQVFDEIESPLISVLYDMELDGIELDVEGLASFSKKLKKKIDTLRSKITAFADEDLNVNSPSQLAVVLFEKLELPTKGIKKTKTGYSTAASELEKLWDAHEIVPLIAEYRELAKLQSTYVEALPKLVGSDGRVHTTYNQAVAATGRLSSSDPNLQNIPIKTELGREIRKAFVVPRGKRLIAADYSQIELRLAAVISKDKSFTTAFKEGADIHTRTAAEVWEIDEDKVTKDQRRA